MTTRLVIGIDPGLTTGVALLDPSVPSIIDYQELKYRDELWEYFRALPLDGGGYEEVYITVEQYVITASTGKLSQQTWSLRAIGFLEAMADEKGWRWKQYMAASAKNLVTDDRIRALGLYRPGMGHARDALRHAILHGADYLGYHIIR